MLNRCEVRIFFLLDLHKYTMIQLKYFIIKV